MFRNCESEVYSELKTCISPRYNRYGSLQLWLLFTENQKIAHVGSTGRAWPASCVPSRQRQRSKYIRTETFMMTMTVCVIPKRKLFDYVAYDNHVTLTSGGKTSINIDYLSTLLQRLTELTERMKQKQTTILSSGRPSSWKQKTTEAGMKSMTYRTGDPNRYFVVVERERERGGLNFITQGWG